MISILLSLTLDMLFLSIDSPTQKQQDIFLSVCEQVAYREAEIIANDLLTHKEPNPLHLQRAIADVLDTHTTYNQRYIKRLMNGMLNGNFVGLDNLLDKCFTQGYGAFLNTYTGAHKNRIKSYLSDNPFATDNTP